MVLSYSMDTQTKLNYKKVLSMIAEDRGLFELSKYILDFKEVIQIQKIKYNITSLPEAVCDGCEG